MSRTTALALAAAFALTVVTGCGSSEPTETFAGSASSSSTAPSALSEPADTVAASPLHGSWRLELTAEEIGAALEASGFGELTDQFLQAEEIDGSLTQVLTLEDDRFAFAYQSGPAAWHVGWKGPFTLDGDTLTLQDELSPGTDTLRWAVSGDELTFESVEANDVVINGIPNEAFHHAYLTSAPFVRTDCVPTDSDCEG